MQTEQTLKSQRGMGKNHLNKYLVNGQQHD